MLVTGGTGYVGRHLSRRLLRDGHAVAVLHRPTSSTAALPASVTRYVYDGSIRGVIAALTAFKPDVVFHLAARGQAGHGVDDVDRLIQANFAFGLHLLEGMAQSGCSTLVSTGSYWEYAAAGESTYAPNTLYAALKRAFHDVVVFYCRTFGMRAARLVLYDVYGPDDDRPKLVPSLMVAARDGNVIPATQGTQQLDLTYVDDVVDALAEAGRHALDFSSGTCLSWGVSSNSLVTVRELADEIARVSGSPMNVEWGAMPFAKGQIFEPVRALSPVPGWTPAVNLTEGLSRVWRECLEGGRSNPQPDAFPAVASGAPARPLVSICIPVFNEEENVERAYRALSSVMNSVADQYDAEFVFTDNHSTDSTFAILQQLAAADRRVRVYRFSRNFGYQRSIHTGYMKTRGDVAVQFDCDLQDPPEMIPEFLRLWRQGNKVVYGIRRSRREGWLITTTRKVFYRLVEYLSDEPVPRDAGDFRLIDRRILDALRSIRDSRIYLRGRIAEMGFQQIGVPYDRRERELGTPKFTLSQYFRLAIDAVTAHSALPLRLSAYFGVAITSVTFVAALAYLVASLTVGRPWPAGFTTLVLIALMSLGLMSLFLGILGEYLARIYEQVKQSTGVLIESSLNDR